MGHDISQFDKPVNDPMVLERLKETIALMLESDRLFREYPVQLPPQVRAKLQQLVGVELDMQAMERTWPAEPPLTREQHSRVVQTVQSELFRQLLQKPVEQPSLAETLVAHRSDRGGNRRLWLWGGGLAIAACVAFAAIWLRPAPLPSTPISPISPSSGTATIALSNLEIWNDPELEDISVQLSLVETESSGHHSTTPLDKLLVSDPLSSELDRLERNSLWEDSL